jgi:hypothetical protein
VITDYLLAKEVAAPTGPAAAQVTSISGCSVTDRESPWVTALTGTWRARYLAALRSPCCSPAPASTFRSQLAM